MKYKLEEILKDKGYIRGPFGSALKRAEMKKEGIPVYEQANAINDHRIFRYFVDDEKFNELKRFQVQTNDIIISCSGTVGEASIIKESDQKGIISQALLILRPDETTVIPKYLYYFFKSRDGKNALLSRSSGSVQVNIAKKNIIQNIPINLPSIKKQKNIVYYLDLLSSKIETNKSTILNLEELAQTLFKRWFVDFEFPNEEGKPYKSSGGKMVESELGMIPEGWGVKFLGTIGEFKNGINYNRNTKGDTAYKVVNVRDIVGSHTLLDYELDEISVDFNKGKGYQLEIGDTVIVRSASPGETCFIDKVVEHYIYSGFCIRFRPNNYEYSLFSYYHLSNLKRELDSYSTGTTLKNLNQKILKSVKLTIPNDNILKDFQNRISVLMRKVRQQKEEVEKLQKLRDTLLPKLLSGEIELPDDMEVTDDVPIS